MVLSSVACSPASSEAPLRSPTRDYPPAPTTTADGETLGADGVEPADRLGEGPSAGTDSSLAPGWKAEDGKLTHDPKERVGGAVDTTPERAPATPVTPR
ncbi:MAG TPA: hypothetical protein VER33_11595 [Polyangiaceae bacterium]|nr:hypothetical protein [Polyangiaceae bacterium]